MVALVKTRRIQANDNAPDSLSEWTMPPGEAEPIRCFESAEAAMAFLRTHKQRAPLYDFLAH